MNRFRPQIFSGTGWVFEDVFDFVELHGEAIVEIPRGKKTCRYRVIKLKGYDQYQNQNRGIGRQQD